jgi:hypothetical protein
MAPHHLAKFDIIPDSSFTSEEVYRRCPFGQCSAPYKKEDLFLDTRWDDLLNGLSVNRSKYAQPNDVLWAFVDEDPENKKCRYEERTGIVFSSKAELYPIEDPQTGVGFSLAHTPINCNVSHCDIVINNIPKEINKPKKREIKAFLATLFQEIAPEK